MTRLTALPNDERCRVALIGDASIAMHCLRSLKAAGHEVVACLANGEAFAAAARRQGITTYDPGTPLTALTEIPCDWIVSAYNTHLIPAAILRHPARGTINFHDAPLPRYAGLYAPTRALIEGEKEYGVTWHIVEEGIDTGGIVIQTPVPIHDDDTSHSLNLRCLEAGARGFDMIAPKLGLGPLAHQQQDLSERTYFGNSNWPREGMEINWQWPAKRIQRMVRALDFGPFPNYIGNARFRFNGGWYRLLDAEQCPDQHCPCQNAQPGTISTSSDGRLHIATSEDCLIATSLAPTLLPEECLRVGHVEVRNPDELSRIAAWEEGIFKYEAGWLRKMQRRIGDSRIIEPMARSSRESSTVDLGTTSHDLACSLLAWALTFGKAHIDVGHWWTDEELSEFVAPAGDPALGSLLHPVVPISVAINEVESILKFADKWLKSVADTQRRGPFFADLLDRGGEGKSLVANPASLPIQWLQKDVKTPGIDVSSWRVRKENGRWLASALPNMSHVEDLAKTLRKVIKDQPSTRIADLPRLATNTELLLRSWEKGESFEATPKSFVELIFDRFVSSKNSTAIEAADGRVWTYGRLGREVAFLMARLRETGVEQGDMVPLRLGRSPELITAQLAVMGLGCAFVPISDEDPDLRVLDVLKRTHARVAIGLPIQGSDATTWIAPLSDHEESETERLVNREGPHEEGIACVFFTSGSTGRPKGVKITHRGLDAYIDYSISYFRPETFQRSIWTSSVAFDSTLSEVMISLVVGGSVVIPKPESVWSIRGFVESLASYEITFVAISTALWSMWMRDAPHITNPIPSTLLLVDVGGGVLSPELAERWFSLTDGSIRFCNGYGPTESTVVCTHYDITRESLIHPSIPIGFPNQGAMIRILDEQGRRVAPGIAGEIVIGGLGVADGYLDDAEETNARFVQLADDGGWWYRSGDLGSWTADGKLLFHGRADEQVKIHGYRVEPEEIGRAVRNLSGVKDAEVIAFEASASKELRAVVIRLAASNLDVEEVSRANLNMSDQDWTVWLQNQLEEQLPRHAVPRRWLLVAEWPRTTTGKVDRVDLASRFSSESQQSDLAEPLHPRNADSVLQLIRKVLPRPGADPSESFFELGGDSLAAMGLQLKLEAAVGKSLPLSLVYGSKTIAAIIEGVANEADRKEVADDDCWHSITTSPDSVDFVFMPGMSGHASFSHIWPEVGDFASVHAIKLGIEDYRKAASEVQIGETIRHLADQFARLVIERLSNRRPILVGYSLSGWFAFETANAMLRLGAPAPQLLMIEPGIYNVDGGKVFRIRNTLDQAIDRLMNSTLLPLVTRNLRYGLRKFSPSARPRTATTATDHDCDIDDTLLRLLASYHPVPGTTPMHLVVREKRARIFATWRRLARGTFEQEEVPLVAHTDFVKPGSKPILTELLRRVAAMHDC